MPISNHSIANRRKQRKRRQAKGAAANKNHIHHPGSGLDGVSPYLRCRHNPFLVPIRGLRTPRLFTFLPSGEYEVQFLSSTAVPFDHCR